MKWELYTRQLSILPYELDYLGFGYIQALTQVFRENQWFTYESNYGLSNTLRPRQNGRHFPDDTFKCIFMNENVGISINISLKFVPKGLINNIPASVQIMAWRRPGDKPLSEPMMISLPTHICVTRPQWVNFRMRNRTRSQHFLKYYYHRKMYTTISVHILVIFFCSELSRKMWVGSNDDVAVIYMIWCSYKWESVVNHSMSEKVIIHGKSCNNSLYPPLQRSWKGVYWYHLVCLSVCLICLSVRLWTESCPLCIFKNTHRIPFIFAHLIKQLRKVCRVQCPFQNSEIWYFGDFYKFATLTLSSFDFGSNMTQWYG